MANAESLDRRAILYGQIRLSPDLNSYNVMAVRDEVDVSTFDTDAGGGGNAHQYIKGPSNESIEFQGFGGSSRDFDMLTRLAADTSSDSMPVVIHRIGDAPGARCFFEECQLTKFDSLGGDFGNAFGYQGTFRPHGRIELAHLLYSAIGGTPVTATGPEAGFEIEALGSGEELKVCLIQPDLPAIAGGSPSLTAILESDTTSGFAGPTTRHTFTALTAAGFEVATIDGDSTPITDTYFRINWSAVTGTFYPVVAAFIRQKLG